MTKVQMVSQIVNENCVKHNLYYIDRTRKNEIENVYQKYRDGELSHRQAKKRILETIFNKKNYY